MQRLLLCLLALSISTASSAQLFKKNKKKTDTEQTDSTSIKKETKEPEVKKEVEQKKDDPQVDTTKKEPKAKKDYKKANNTAREKNNTGSNSGTKEKTTTNGKTQSKTNTPTPKPKPAPKPKPMTNAEKKAAEKEAEEKEAATPKGVEAYFYSLPIEDLPVVTEFMAIKQEASPHARIKDDISLRKQIIRYKNIDKGYMELQKPGDTKYTRLQTFKKDNGNMVMVVEQSNCNPYCTGTLNFFVKSAGGWRDVTSEYYPTIDNKWILSRLKTKYKKEYKDLDLYNAKGYDDNEANLKKAITYKIAPDDAKIVIQEQYLPCALYEMIWDGKKEKFDLKKIEK